MGSAWHITNLDLTSGYWQIPITKETKEKTAFCTPEGNFQYKSLPLVYYSVQATFQKAMDQNLHPHHTYTLVYLDEIVIFNTDWESHLPRVQVALDSEEGGVYCESRICAIVIKETK